MSRPCKYLVKNHLIVIIIWPPCRMLDEFGAEIEHTESRLDATMKKIAKVLHMSDGKLNI